MRLIAGLSENHQRPTATRDERLSFVVTLAGSAAAVSVKGSMRSEEIVSTMGGAPERLYFVPAAGSGGGKAICAAPQWPHSVLHLEKTCIECKKVFYQKKKCLKWEGLIFNLFLQTTICDFPKMRKMLENVLLLWQRDKNVFVRSF